MVKAKINKRFFLRNVDVTIIIQYHGIWEKFIDNLGHAVFWGKMKK